MKLRITVDQKTYEVDVEVAEDERPAASHTYTPTAAVTIPTAPPLPHAVMPDAGVAEDKVCRSPVAGVVVRLNTQVGQQIQANDSLLVLEAMKMETNVTSPVAGKIKAITAGPGDAVQTGQVLVEFE